MHGRLGLADPPGPVGLSGPREDRKPETQRTLIRTESSAGVWLAPSRSIASIIGTGTLPGRIEPAERHRRFDRQAAASASVGASRAARMAG